MSETCIVCASRNDMSQLGNARANGTMPYFAEKQKFGFVKKGDRTIIKETKQIDKQTYNGKTLNGDKHKLLLGTGRNN